MRAPRPSARAVGLVTAVVGATIFAAVAVWLVPWEPVPGGVPDPVPVGEVLTPGEVSRAEEYSASARFWSWGSLALTLAVLLVLALTRAGPALVRRFSGRRWWLSVPTVVAAVLVVVRLVTLPLALGSWRLRREYGLSTQSGLDLAGDLARNLALDVVLHSAVLLIVLGCARRWRAAWPAVSAAVLGSLVVLGSFVYPLVVEPVFNSFEPLPEGALREEITAVASAQGVAVDDVVVADASRRTTTLNAWVSGLGATRRVVLYDNLVDEVEQDQVMAVVAHELAHARHGDVWVGTALGACGALVGAGALGALLGTGRGRRVLGGPAAVPVLVLLLAVGAQLAAPVQNGISRRIELRADVEALRSTGDPASFVELQVSLARRSLADPTPPRISAWWWGSHPGLLTRVALAERTSASRTGALSSPDR